MPQEVGMAKHSMGTSSSSYSGEQVVVTDALDVPPRIGCLMRLTLYLVTTAFQRGTFNILQMQQSKRRLTLQQIDLKSWPHAQRLP